MAAQLIPAGVCLNDRESPQRLAAYADQQIPLGDRLRDRRTHWRRPQSTPAAEERAAKLDRRFPPPTGAPSRLESAS